MGQGWKVGMLLGLWGGIEGVADGHGFRGRIRVIHLYNV